MNINKEFINKLREYALGDDDMEKILGKDLFIFVYPYLDDVKHIDEVFDEQGRSLMLFLTEDINTGHWICMIKKGDEINYFDPYGNKPDEDLKWLDDRKRDELDQETPKLTKLLKESGYKVFYNTYPFQKDGDNINTCGRWCALRLLYKDKTLKQFYDMIRKYMKEYKLNGDEVVSILTYRILGK